MTEMPLDDYHFKLNSIDQQVRHIFLTLLPEGEKLLWVGKMKRGLSYWLTKGLLALAALISSVFITSFLWQTAYIGFFNGEQAGKYPRVFVAFGASLLPWIASYVLLFRRIIYDTKARYALSQHYALLYLPFDYQNPYQRHTLAQLYNLGYKEHLDDSVSINYSIEVPNDRSGATHWVDIPLFDFLEEGLKVFDQLSSLQQAAIEEV